MCELKGARLCAELPERQDINASGHYMLAFPRQEVKYYPQLDAHDLELTESAGNCQNG